jgi:hypothetical protein
MAAQNLNGQQTNPVFSDENLSDFTSIPSLMLFAAKDFTYWWYVQMPVWYVMSLRRIATVVDDQLSISLLLRTFFVPWHRDYSFTGHLVGVLARIFYLPVALAIFLFCVVGYLAFILFWLLIPIATLLLIILSPVLRYS